MSIRCKITSDYYVPEKTIKDLRKFCMHFWADLRRSALVARQMGSRFYLVYVSDERLESGMWCVGTDRIRLGEKFSGGWSRVILEITLAEETYVYPSAKIW